MRAGIKPNDTIVVLNHTPSNSVMKAMLLVNNRGKSESFAMKAMSFGMIPKSKEEKEEGGSDEEEEDAPD